MLLSYFLFSLVSFPCFHVAALNKLEEYIKEAFSLLLHSHLPPAFCPKVGLAQEFELAAKN